MLLSAGGSGTAAEAGARGAGWRHVGERAAQGSSRCSPRAARVGQRVSAAGTAVGMPRGGLAGAGGDARARGDRARRQVPPPGSGTSRNGRRLGGLRNRAAGSRPRRTRPGKRPLRAGPRCAAAPRPVRASVANRSCRRGGRRPPSRRRRSRTRRRQHERRNTGRQRGRPSRQRSPQPRRRKRARHASLQHAVRAPDRATTPAGPSAASSRTAGAAPRPSAPQPPRPRRRGGAEPDACPWRPHARGSTSADAVARTGADRARRHRRRPTRRGGSRASKPPTGAAAIPRQSDRPGRGLS